MNPRAHTDINNYYISKQEKVQIFMEKKIQVIYIDQ